MRGNYLRITHPLHIPGSWETCWWDASHQHMLVFKNSAFYIWRPDGPKGTSLSFFQVKKTGIKCEQIFLAKVSLDMRLLAVQLSSTKVCVFDVNSTHNWIISIKSQSNNRILPYGILWSEHGGGSQDLVIVTTRGLEMWKVSPQRKQCKLSRTVTQGLSFHAKFWYEPNFRCIVLSSPQKTTTSSSHVLQSIISASIEPASAYSNSSNDMSMLQQQMGDVLAPLGPLHISGYFFKVSKETLPKLELPPPDKSPVLKLDSGAAENDISLETLYGKLYIAIRKDASKRGPSHNVDVIDLYELSIGSVTHTHTVSLGSSVPSSIATSVVDNLLIVHSHSAQCSRIFDIASAEDFTNGTETSDPTQIHILCPAAPIVAHSASTPQTAMTSSNTSSGESMGDGALAVPTVEGLSVPLTRHKSHQQQLDESKLPYDAMQACDYIYDYKNEDQVKDSDTSEITAFAKRSNYTFLAPCWLWDMAKRCLWRIRPCVADIAAVTHDPRVVIGFLRRRGQIFRAIRPVYFYSKDKEDSDNSKRLLLHKVGAAVEGKVSMSYLEATFSAVARPYARAVRAATKSSDVEPNVVHSAASSTSSSPRAPLSPGILQKSAVSSIEVGQIESDHSGDARWQELPIESEQKEKDEKRNDNEDTLSSIFALGNSVTTFVENTHATLSAMAEQQISYIRGDVPISDSTALEPQDALHMLLSDITSIGSRRHRITSGLKGFGNNTVTTGVDEKPIDNDTLINGLVPPLQLTTARDPDGNLVLTQIETLSHIWLPLILLNNGSLSFQYMSFALMLYQTVTRSYGAKTHPAMALSLLKLLGAQKRFMEVGRLLQLQFFPDTPEIAMFSLDLYNAIDIAQQEQHQIQQQQKIAKIDDTCDDNNVEQWFVGGRAGMKSATSTLRQVGLDMLWRLGERTLVVRWLLGNGHSSDAMALCGKQKNQWRRGLDPGTVSGVDFYKAVVNGISTKDAAGNFLQSYSQRVGRLYSLVLFLREWDPEVLEPDTSIKSEVSGPISNLAVSAPFPQAGVFQGKDVLRFKDLLGYRDEVVFDEILC